MLVREVIHSAGTSKPCHNLNGRPTSWPIQAPPASLRGGSRGSGPDLLPLVGRLSQRAGGPRRAQNPASASLSKEWRRRPARGQSRGRAYARMRLARHSMSIRQPPEHSVGRTIPPVGRTRQAQGHRDLAPAATAARKPKIKGGSLYPVVRYSDLFGLVAPWRLRGFLRFPLLQWRRGAGVHAAACVAQSPCPGSGTLAARSSCVVSSSNPTNFPGSDSMSRPRRPEQLPLPPSCRSITQQRQISTASEHLAAVCAPKLA
jgi:hypothetical protein